MEERIVQRSLGMPRGSMLRIDDGAGVTVYVLQGQLWITEEGNLKDHLVETGQWFRVRRGGTALAHALRRSVVGLSTPDARMTARSIALTRPGSAVPAVLHRRARESFGDVLRRMKDAVLAPLSRPADVR